MPPPPPPPPPPPKARNPFFDTRLDFEMEYILWTIFLSGTLGIFGFPIVVGLGYGTYIYLTYIAILNLLEVIQEGKDFNDWT